MDVLALPVLAIVTVAFLIYIWAGWLSDRRKRALTITDDDGEDSRDQTS
ncbi:MAG: hypothetical protein JSR98_15030 [Proteobacteria bacterium]|nr:hypothetical protein [Pseudomonadota bacterium]